MPSHNYFCLFLSIYIYDSGKCSAAPDHLMVERCSAEAETQWHFPAAAAAVANQPTAYLYANLESVGGGGRVIFTNGDLTCSCTLHVPGGPLKWELCMVTDFEHRNVLVESSLSLQNIFIWNIEKSRSPTRSVLHGFWVFFGGCGGVKTSHNSNFEMLITCTQGDLLNKNNE